MEHFITIRHNNQDITATLHYPNQQLSECGKSPCRWPVVVICHGFVGSRIGVDRLFVGAARTLAGAGYMVLRFDYIGCGESTGDYGSEGLGSMVGQTRRVLDYVTALDCVDSNRVVLLGHSLGGAVSILTAAEDKRVKSLVLWSAVANPLHDIVKIVGEDAYLSAIQTGVSDHLGYGLRTHFFESLSHFSPTLRIREFSGDVLLVHGTNDEIIPPEYSKLYQKLAWQRASGQCDLEEVEGADHTYSSKAAKDSAIHITRQWLLSVDKRKTDWNDWTI